MTTVEDVRIIELPKFADPRGNLSFVEQLNHIPFKIKRTYWIYDVPGGENRGGHAFRQNDEFIVSLSGAFEVIVDDFYTINLACGEPVHEFLRYLCSGGIGRMVEELRAFRAFLV